MTLLTNPTLRQATGGGASAPVENSLIPATGVIGMPPSTYESGHVIRNAMPVAQIIPCKPNFTTGMTLFSLVEDWANYEKILKTLGFTTQKPIKVAFLADNFPTDSFTNEYGETFITKMADVASQGIRDIMQITGSRTVGEGVGKIAGMVKGMGEGAEGMLGSILKTAGEWGGKGASGLQGIEKRFGAAGTISGIIAGNRVDFPQVWKNSNFTPSYTMTVRLYNPNPGNLASTKEFIVGPLAVLLCLAIPRSRDGNTYGWPFFHKIKCPGIYNLNPGVITNISVIKGGDQLQIAQNQSLGMVDVRIDFVSLFNSMLVEEGNRTISNRPTLRTYLQSLLETKDTEEHYETARMMAGIIDEPSEVETTGGPQLINNMAASRQAATHTGPALIPRVSVEDEATEEELLEEMSQTGLV